MLLLVIRHQALRHLEVAASEKLAMLVLVASVALALAVRLPAQYLHWLSHLGHLDPSAHAKARATSSSVDDGLVVLCRRDRRRKTSFGLRALRVRT